MIHPTRTTQTRKTPVSLKTKTKERKKNNTTKEWKWRNKEKPMMKKECTLESKVPLDLDHSSTHFDIFQWLQE